MVDNEEYFPRGGTKPAVTHFKQSSNFLGSAEKGEKKKKKIKKKQEGDDGYLTDEAPKEVDLSYRNCAVGISYKTAKPELLILGRVRQVLETKVNLMLPGRMMGSVAACHISDAYNKLLEAYVNDEIEKVTDLSSMFRAGQYVAAKVIEKTDKDNLMMSMMPQHVNGGIQQSDIRKGMLFQSAVSSVEDHGYVMDIGVINTRAFLPKANTNPEIELEEGMLVWCCVQAVSAAAVALSAAPAALQNAFLKRTAPSNMLPANAVDFIVDKPLDNGIEGHIFQDQTAYIQANHADKVKGKKPALGQKIRARLLYVMPPLNTPFLTMRGIFESTYPDLSQEQQFKEGDIIDNAQVIKIRSRSVHFRLGEGSLGSMSLKRVQTHEDFTDEEVLAKSYPIGSTHKVRVLCYYLSDYVYSVSDEPSVLSERYFSLNQLEPGQTVPGRVTSVADAHVLVAVGRLSGYVPKSHMTDAGVFVDPKKATVSKLAKKKFKVGQEVKARVLCVDPVKQTLFLTLKPSLIAAEQVLTSYDQVEIGKAYIGTIKVVKDYLLVTFFNNVTAYIPKYYASPTDTELKQVFHVGQLATCTAIFVDSAARKMTASLTIPAFWPNKKPKHVSKPETDTQTDSTESLAKKRKNSDISENTSGSKDKDTHLNKRTKRNTEETDNKGKNNDSTESDAIETDIEEGCEELLSPADQALLDLTDCTTAMNCKQRLARIIKSIKAKIRKIKRIDEKIVRLETKGITTKNKKNHSAMKTEKILVSDRLAKLEEVKSVLEEKRSELKLENAEKKAAKIETKKEARIETKKEAKKKKKEHKSEKQSNKTQKEEKTTQELENSSMEVDETSKEDEIKKVKRKDLLKDIKVVESLEPVIDIPSAKDFWSSSDKGSKLPEQEELSSSDEEQMDQPKKKRKKLTPSEKVAKAREEEERLRELERRAVESESRPQSTEQFERALLANPNCSQLWIAYMAFHLQSTEIEKARNVGRKALTTISFREEQEKLNVWLAMINFENRFGTKESQQKILEEALQMNDTFKIHSQLLDIYVESGKQQELSSLVELMLRKYKKNPQTYTLCGAACFKMDLVEKARHCMQKAVSVLEKKEHIPVLVQFALLERSHGGVERAEALFEHVLAAYPQRVDICNVYVDMLVKNGNVQRVREVLERMTSHKLPARKMKVLFKKWVEVEEKIGNKEQAESIRQRALEFVNKAQF